MADLKPFTGELDATPGLTPMTGRMDGESSGAIRRLADTGLSLAKGVIGVPEAAVGIADLVTGGRAGKLVEQAGVRFKDAKGVLDDLYSPEQKAANQEVQDAKGFLPTLGAMTRNPSTIVNAAVESAPSMLVGGVASRGVLAAAPRIGAIGAGAIGEGITAAGQNAEQVRQEDPNGTLTGQQAAILAASGVLTGGISLGAGKVANKLGIGDVQTMLAAGKTGAVGADAVAAGANKGVIRKAAEGVAAEGVLQELPQSYQEQVGQNLAQGKPWDEGAAEAGAQGMMAGGLMGGMAGPLGGHSAPATKLPPSAAPADKPPQLGLNPSAGTHTVFPDGSVILNSDTPAGEQAVFDKRHAPQPIKPSEAMGLDPAAGPMSAAAVLAVDSGLHQTTKDAAEAEQQQLESAATQAKAATEKIAQSSAATQAGDVNVGQSPEVSTVAPVADGRGRDNAAPGVGSVLDSGNQPVGAVAAAADPAGRAPEPVLPGAGTDTRAVADETPAQRDWRNQLTTELATGMAYGKKLNPLQIKMRQGQLARATGAQEAPSSNPATVETLGTPPVTTPLPVQQQEAVNVQDLAPRTQPEPQPQTTTAQAAAAVATPAAEPAPGVSTAGRAGVEAAGVDRLSPKKSRQLQEAHKALGHDVTRQQVQRMRDGIAREVNSGKTNNGGVLATLTTKALNERRAQLARLDADLSLFGEAATSAAGKAPATQADIKAITAKQIPQMTNAELQQAITHYGPDHQRTPKLQAALDKRPGVKSAATSVNQIYSNPASWVLKEKATGQVVMETTDPKKVAALNTEKYVAVPIAEHLAGLDVTAPAAPANPANPSPQGTPREPQANQAQPQQARQPEAPAGAVADTNTEVAPRPANWRGNFMQAAKVARDLKINSKGKKLATLVAEIEAHGFEQNLAQAQTQAQVFERTRAADLSTASRARLTAAYRGEPYKGVKEDYKTLRADLESRAQDVKFADRGLAQEVLDGMDDAIANLNLRKKSEQAAQSSEVQESDVAGAAGEVAPDTFVKTNTLGMGNIHVKQADLDSERVQLPIYSANGQRKGGTIHRENLDPTGEKKTADNEANADNPLFNVITRKDGTAFPSKPAANRELNKQALGTSHEVVSAEELKSGASGYVLRKRNLVKNSIHPPTDIRNGDTLHFKGENYTVTEPIEGGVAAERVIPGPGSVKETETRFFHGDEAIGAKIEADKRKAGNPTKPKDTQKSAIPAPLATNLVASPSVEKATPAPAKRQSVAVKAAAAQQARADYFTPGNIVNSYGGQDEVLSYTPPTKEGGSWSVQVQAVEKQGGQWVRIGKPQDARWHSTQPDPSELKAGPVQRAAAQSAVKDPTQTADIAEFKGKARATGTPIDTAIMDMVREGREARDVLGLVAGTSKSRFNRQVARLLLNTGVTPKVVLEQGALGGEGNFTFLARYSRKNNALGMTEGALPQAEHIFMHEMMHAATLRALDRNGLASLQMRRLYEHVKKQGGANGQYGMKNVGEFVAEVFTNQEFQREIKGMSAPSGSTLKTSWDGFVRIMRSILGLNQDSTDALSRALELGVAVMREDKALRQRGVTGRGRDANAGVARSSIDQTQTEAFKKWFGDSKVVDAQGKPLVVYHGTKKKFSKFDAGKTMDGAFWFTSNLDAIKSGEVGAAANGTVMPVYLSAKKLAGWDEYERLGYDQLIQRGYDGMELDGDYVVFDPTQIKSSTDNNGDFDPANPDIRFSHQGTVPRMPTEQEIRWADAVLKAARPKKSSVDAVRKAVRQLVNGLGAMPNGLGRIVVATAEEIKSEWEPIIGPVDIKSESKGDAQGFYSPKSRTVFLIADHINAGEELGVAAHELMHKHGQDVLSKAGWDKLHGTITGWKDAEATSMERQVYEEAARRVEDSGAHLSNQELFPYAVQIALEMGVRPNAMAQEGTVARWLAGVRQALRQAWDKITNKPDQFKAQDMVNLAFGIAQMENPAHATSMKRALDRQNAEAIKAAQRGTNTAVTNPKDVVGNTQDGRSADDTSPGASVDESTGLPLNADGTVTLYHHTSAANAKAIRTSGKLKADAEPDVYVTTHQETDTGYGDTAVPIRVRPDQLSIDDEFPNGRKDFRLHVGKPGGSIKVTVENESTAPDSGGAPMFSRSKVAEKLSEKLEQRGEHTPGRSGRQYTPEQRAAMKNVGLSVETPSLKDRAQALWKDAGKKLAQGIADQFAPVRDMDKDAYTLLRLSKGASGAFEALLHGGQLKLTDNVYDFNEAKRGGVIDTLLKPLQGEHHDFLRWVAANRAERLKGEGKENLFTPGDITALKSLADGKAAFDYTVKNGIRKGQVTRNRAEIYRDSLVTFNGFQNNILDMAEQSGLIDGDARQLWEHEFYVPFYRVEDDGSVAGADIKSSAVRQMAFKSLTGRENKLNADLLDNTLMNWAHLLDASAKNRAAKATLEAAEKMGIAIHAPEATARDMARDAGNKSGVVWFRENGEKRFSFVDDPYVLTALTSLEYAGMRNPAMNAMSAFKHALTLGVTASPYFKIRNLIRDSVQVIASGPIGYNPVANVAQGWKLTDPKSDAYFRLLAGGGTIHFGTMMEGSEGRRVQSLVESGVAQASILDSDEKVKAFYRKFIKPGITAYNELGDRGEAINRAALYDQLVKQGVSHAEASIQARDLMDFSMQGSFTSVRFLTQVVPFMNARIQGLYKLGKAAKEDPKRFAAVLGATAMFSLALLAAYSDDDDWKKREEWDRNNFWWFKFGGTAFRIPKPFEIGAIGTLAERGFELAFDKEMTNKRFMNQVMTLLGDNLSMNPVPQLVKPVIDMYANKDSFSGRPIETMGMEKLQSEYRFTNRTSMVARGASTAANAVTGMVGISAPSPVQVDHLLRSYFGWLGSFVVGAADVLARPATDQPGNAAPDYWKTATGSIASSLDGASSRYVSQMYDQAKEIEQAYGTWRALLKEGKTDEAKSFMDANKTEISKHKFIERVKKSAALLNQQIKHIERSDMPGDEKRAQIIRLREQQDRVARQVA